jgi:hypothetical protein
MHADDGGRRSAVLDQTLRYTTPMAHGVLAMPDSRDCIYPSQRTIHDWPTRASGGAKPGKNEESWTLPKEGARSRIAGQGAIERIRSVNYVAAGVGCS